MHSSYSGLISSLGNLEVCGYVCALLAMGLRRQLAKFKALALFLMARLAMSSIWVLTDQMSRHHLNKHTAYVTWFYSYWTLYAVEAILGFFVIFGIYNLSMAPLPGLQRLGMLMFRWAGGIAVAIALTMAVGPHTTTNKFMQVAVTKLQETQSVLTLCMLLFVCLAIRPMGLSYRSKIFGVCLGLGVLATCDLVSVAWLQQNKSLFSIYNVIGGLANCSTMAIWIAYFAIPEPKRRMIILPTTSPFLRWNQISLALGDEPGFVAIGEVSPDMFAPAEVEIMRRASVKMRLTGTS